MKKEYEPLTYKRIRDALYEMTHGFEMVTIGYVNGEAIQVPRVKKKENEQQIGTKKESKRKRSRKTGRGKKEQSFQGNVARLLFIEKKKRRI